MNPRELVKRFAPAFAKDAFIAARRSFAAPPLEQIKLHDYQAVRDDGGSARLTLVIPSLAAKNVFGGIDTGVDFMFRCAKAASRTARIVIDDFGDDVDAAFLAKAATRAGFDVLDVEVVRRTAETEPVEVRADDIFLAYNWWTAINLRGLRAQQEKLFGARPGPLLYIVQEYEPAFYPMSSTHMVARAALDDLDTIGIFNSSELHAYFKAQGHAFGREYVFEPRMPASLRAALKPGAPKERRMLVYGRPSVPRNCFPAVVAALRSFVDRHPEFRDWSFESAGATHEPVDLGHGCRLVGMGKLPIELYAHALETAAVGLSLMSSPHPSYPPLEMAHYGIRTVTNGYACKEMSKAHGNIVSVRDVLPSTVAAALAESCASFIRDPQAGWAAKSNVEGYVDGGPYPFMPELVATLARSPAKVEAGTA